ncbi:MAG: membrane protein insertase YidC [Spirochaetales bacterium]|nr:membrane protein insertase YidC [Spirochaetales bacterium]
MEQKSTSNPISSLLPVIIMSAAALFIFQYFGSEQTEKPEARLTYASTGQDDFTFRTGAVEREEVQTENFFLQLTNRGGRIEKVYLRSTDRFTFPERVIEGSADPIAQKVRGVEITRGFGADFQPHLYYYGDQESQLGDPRLNQARFESSGLRKTDDQKLQTIEYRLPLTFKGHDLELIKYYRFYPNEYFFRQITLLRNTENKPFQLNGDLFFRTMGDLGPVPATPAEQTLHHRFYVHNDTMTQTTMTHGEGGFLNFSCGASGSGPYTIIPETLNERHKLRVAGSSSKYFFAYANFLPFSSMERFRPDGIALKNSAGDGQAAFTLYFSNFALEKRNGPAPELQKKTPLSAKELEDTLSALQERKDIHVIDSQVFIGIKSDRGHSFFDPVAMKAEFASDTPDPKANDVIYASQFFTLFGKIRDGIVFLMRHLYKYVGNYGWCIIIIAVGFKLITFPLNQIQAKSMKKMSLLKPELDKLNEKYANDPTERNKKMMELYKKHGINPAKGCLPMLIQMPVFIALYSAFSESIELWNSPFVLWMTDLSRPDTIAVLNLFVINDFHVNILPLLMVVSQIGSQFFTTVTADPQQKVMMYMMPVIFIFFFWSMPSGVTLYWTVQNILAIVWQLANNKLVSDEK